MALSIIGKLATRLGQYACKKNQHDYRRGSFNQYSSHSTGQHEISSVVCRRCGEIAYYVPLEENL